METNPPNAAGESIASVQPSIAPLDVIRTETVFSKLPIHNLAKKGRVDIQILKTSPDGQVELKWEVSYSDRYGQARQLAYKLDTIVIDERLEETGKPLPERIRLGSLNQIAQELGIDADQGPNAKNIKRAFMQNAFAGITAKLKYKGNDGTEHTFEAGFTRYSVIFTGQKFADGSKADAVYIELHPRYREVLNNAPVRPLDLGYKKQLPPAAQRFYEIVSYKIFTALKYNQAAARLAYSEYCTFSAQQRYFDYDHFKKQMYKVLKPHKDSGYITDVRYEQTTDDQEQLDWNMLFTPGPKARAEFTTFTGKKTRTIQAPTAPQLPVGDSVQRRPRQRRLHLAPAEEPKPTVIYDYRTIAEFTKRGIGESDARAIISTLSPGQPIIDQLEYGDQLIAQSRSPITNPPGFYISLLQRNIPLPATFESSQTRKVRQEAEEAQQQAFLQEQEARLAAEEAQTLKLDQQIDSLTEASRLILLTQAKADLLAKHSHPDFLAHQLKTNPEAGGMLRAAARKLLKDGWQPPAPETPHQTTNPSLRQADPLQLEAVLSTPQLPAPSTVEQHVEQQKSSIDDHLL